MVITDIEKEVRGILNLEGKSMGDVGDPVGIPRQNVWRTLKGGKLTPSLVAILDSLGYDVEINFIKRE